MLRDDLGEAERSLWSAFQRGSWVDLRSGDPKLDDLAGASGWAPERVIRAEVIGALLLGAGEREPGFFSGVRIRGARIVGRLDLMGATVGCAFVCEYCHFEDDLRFVEATTKTVRIVASRLPSFNGARMRVDGILNFCDSVIETTLRLDRGKVVGEVSLRGAAVGQDPDSVAMSADGLNVDGTLECNAGFTARGSILLRGARIGGSVDMKEASISCPHAQALNADNAVIDGKFTGQRMQVEGEFRLNNARVAGWMNLSGARLHNPGGIALGGGGLTVEGSLSCAEGFAADGKIRLIGARLGANLALNGARLANPGGVALDLDRATLGDFDGAELLVSGGQVSLVGAQVAGGVSLVRARLDNDTTLPALALDGAAIGGALALTQLNARGEVSIRTSRIGGRVLLMGARLDNPDGQALRMSLSEITADVFCDDMTATGGVRLAGARIGNELGMRGVQLTGSRNIAIDAEALQAATFRLLPKDTISGTVNLRHAHIGRLIEDPSHWPQPLYLDGLTYEALDPLLTAQQRLRWLARDPNGYQPQPYEQLAALYIRVGQPAEARHVLYAKERHQRATKTSLGRAWGLLQDVTVAYGYRPWRAAVWLAVLLTLGSVIYGITPPRPLQAGAAPHFNPAIYTLDLLLPIVDLGQKHAFNPTGAAQWFSYLLVAAGWILATTIAAGVARTLTRQ